MTNFPTLSRAPEKTDRHRIPYATAPQSKTPNQLLNSHILHLIWTALTLYQALNSGLPARAIWGTLFVVAVALIMRVVLKPHVVELNDTTLTIWIFSAP